jgi:hypothetical protein
LRRFKLLKLPKQVNEPLGDGLLKVVLCTEPSPDAIGMTVFAPRRRVLVIPSATIAFVAPRLECHGRVPRGYLGLGLRLVAQPWSL